MEGPCKCQAGRKVRVEKGDVIAGLEDGKEPQAKGCKQSLGAGSGGTTDGPLRASKGMQPTPSFLAQEVRFGPLPPATIRYKTVLF